ncbi:MAG: DUF2231 domain-containing protein, partial [Thermodesulfobacteriota bacterium]
MRKFEVCMRGENFLVKRDSKLKKTGFHAARFVEAEDMSAATQMAIDSFKAELGADVFNEKGDPPKLSVVEVEEVYYFQEEMSVGSMSLPGEGFLWDKEERGQADEAAKPISSWKGGGGLKLPSKDDIKGLHFHTISVHFSSALFPVACLFIFLYLVTGNITFERSYFYLMVIATLSLPVSYLAGLYEWRRSHQQAMVPIFMAKIRFGVVVFVLGAGATLWRAFSPGVLVEL